jgi:sec-independent protein translocase protein TatA
MFAAIPNSIVLATFLAGWEALLILSLILILLLAKKLPEIMRGMGTGLSEFRKALDQEAQDAGKSAGGIFGKPAAEALTPDNQTAELYDPAVFHRDGKRPSVRSLLCDLWHSLLKLLKFPSRT